mgnify:CR=1 FL=1
MTTSENKMDFITTQEWSKDDLNALIDLAGDVKKNPQNYYNSLLGHSLCMFFFNPSTRTRNSMEVGMGQLGGHAVFNDPKTSWLGQNSESIKDTAAVLSRYHSAIGIRMFPNVVGWKYKNGNEQMREFSRWSRSPIINLEDDMYHPCQALTDIFTMKEELGTVENKKFVLSWAYHPKPLPMSVPNSTLLIATRFGLDVTLACPPKFELHEEIMDIARKNSKESGGSLQIEHKMDSAYEDADVVYVKSWGSLEAYGFPREEKKLRLPYRKKWVCSSELMDLTNKKSIFMHCLPVRRNIVVTDDVIDGKHSIVYDQAENRLHAQKALLLKLMEGKN